jgi:hypothetical protein
LYLAASTGNIKTGFHASGIHPFKWNIFKDKGYKFLLYNVTDKSAPPVGATASTRNSEAPEISVNFPGPST